MNMAMTEDIEGRRNRRQRPIEAEEFEEDHRQMI